MSDAFRRVHPVVTTVHVLLLMMLFVSTHADDCVNCISEDRANGVPNVVVPKPRISMLRFLQTSNQVSNLGVTTTLLSTPGESSTNITDSELDAPNTRATFFTPSDSAWETFARRLYADGNVPIMNSTETIVDAIVSWFQTTRNTFEDVISLFRIVRYHITPGEQYYVNNTQSNGTINTWSGVALQVGDDASLSDFMNETVMVNGVKYLLSNGWVIPIETVLIPFDLDAVLLKVESRPTVTPSPFASKGSITPSTEGSPTDSSSASPSPLASQTADASVSATALPTEEGSSGSEEDEGTCFPGSARVHLQDGSKVRMQDLTGGMKVMYKETGEASAVFLFTHRNKNVEWTFRQLTTACGQSVKMTGNHYVYANGKLTAADMVTVGDQLKTVSGWCSVTEVKVVKEMGLFAPHTLHGDLMVDGVIVSGYSRTVHPDLGHAVLAPVRWFVKMSGIREPLGNVLYNGGHWALRFLPRGKDRF